MCNKEGYGKKAKEEEATAESDGYNSSEHDSEPESNNDETKEKKKVDGGKKRKRGKMIHTGCKATMVVNLIDERWHVAYFMADHNHDLVVKPSLKKFLRSHKGIPQQEKEFITLLHGCNLSTGRIMQLMNEMYGSAQMVPYEGKDVSSFRSKIRRGKKYKDMQEAIDRFREIQQEDPNFFCKVKLDDENRVESSSCGSAVQCSCLGLPISKVRAQFQPVEKPFNYVVSPVILQYDPKHNTCEYGVISGAKWRVSIRICMKTLVK